MKHRPCRYVVVLHEEPAHGPVGGSGASDSRNTGQTERNLRMDTDTETRALALDYALRALQSVEAPDPSRIADTAHVFYRFLTKQDL